MCLWAFWYFFVWFRVFWSLRGGNRGTAVTTAARGPHTSRDDVRRRPASRSRSRVRRGVAANSQLASAISPQSYRRQPLSGFQEVLIVIRSRYLSEVRVHVVYLVNTSDRHSPFIRSERVDLAVRVRSSIAVCAARATHLQERDTLQSCAWTRHWCV